MNIEPQRFIKPVIIASVVVALLSLGLFITTHGVLIVHKEGDGEYTLHKTSDQQFDQRPSKSSRMIVASGSYTIEYKDSNASQTKYVEVPNFLRSATVEFKQTVQRQVERVAAKTLGYLMRGPAGELIGADTSKESEFTYTYASTDPTGLSANATRIPFSGLQTIAHNNQLVGFVPTQPVEYDLALTMHDFASSKTTRSDKIYREATPPRLIRPSSATSNTYGVYIAEDQTITLDIYEGTQVKHTFKNIRDVAEGAETKAIALGKQYIAIGFGRNYASPTADHDQYNYQTGEKEENQSSELNQDYVVKIFDTTSQKELRSFSLGKTNTIANLYIADDGKYVAVEDGTGIKVYDSFNGKQVFAYNATSVTSIQWRDNQRLLFSSVRGGLFELNPGEQSAVTLFSSDALRLSSFQVVGNQILFTAFSNRSTASSSPSPDGYIAYLDQATKDNNQLITQLPFITNSFKLASLGNTIYAAKNQSYVPRIDASGDFAGPEFRLITADETLRKEVTEYLQKTLQNYEQYTLVFGENL